MRINSEQAGPRQPRRGFGFAAALVLFLSLSASPASAVILTFDELPGQPIDNLSFMGVTFDFKVGGLDSPDARYHAGGPGVGTFVQDPSLEGNAAGILTLDFATPVLELQFGVALSTTAALSPGFVISTFDAGLAPLDVFPIFTSPVTAVFSEGQFEYNGVVPIRRAVIDFYDPAGRFAFDNLSFTPVPEPSAMVLAGCGILCLLAAARRRKSVL